MIKLYRTSYREDLSPKKWKECGFVDGGRFLSKKQKLYGTIEEDENGDFITKYDYGMAFIKMNNKGDIFGEPGENLGFMKNYDVFFPDGELYVKFFEERNEIQRIRKYKKHSVVDLIRLEGDLSEIDKIVLFGIYAFFLEIFA